MSTSNGVPIDILVTSFLTRFLVKYQRDEKRERTNESNANELMLTDRPGALSP